VDAASAITSEGFATLQQTALEKQISIYPARAFYPSSLGHPCDRAIVWRFTRWERQAKHDAVLQSIFNEGRHHQPSIYQALETMGFELVRESDRPRQYKTGAGTISGRPDGKIMAFRGEKYWPPLILEAKTMSGYQWDQVKTIEDLRRASSHWTRSYFAQGQLYCFLEDTPFGVFILKSKQTGMLKCLPYELDYAFAEQLLQRVERLQPMVDQGVDPEPIPFDPSICGGCGFRAQCYPPRDFGPGLRVIEEPALLEDLEEIHRLEEAADRHGQLTKSVKERLKAMVGTQGEALIGPWSATLKQVHKASYVVKEHDETHVKLHRSE
jgi:hypothetical protein